MALWSKEQEKPIYEGERILKEELKKHRIVRYSDFLGTCNVTIGEARELHRGVPMSVILARKRMEPF